MLNKNKRELVSPLPLLQCWRSDHWGTGILLSYSRQILSDSSGVGRDASHEDPIMQHGSIRPIGDRVFVKALLHAVFSEALVGQKTIDFIPHGKAAR